MSVKIGISPSLQPFTNNIAVVEVNGSTIGECLTLWLDCAVTPQKGGLRAAAFARAPYFTITGVPESKAGRSSEVGNPSSPYQEKVLKASKETAKGK